MDNKQSFKEFEQTMKALMEKRTEMMLTLLSLIEPTGKEKGCLSEDNFYTRKEGL